MFVIGLTGGIASGKSTVSAYLAACGVPVLDADKIAHVLAQPGEPIWKVFAAHFGEEVLAEDRSLLRGKIGALVFAKEEERHWMDAATHPLIEQEILQQMEECRRKGASVVVLDVPLLFEAGWDKLVDAVWVVYVKPEVQLQRLCIRDHLDKTSALQRIASQMSLEHKKQQADVLIDNGGSEETMRDQVRKYIAPYLQRQEEKDGRKLSDASAAKAQRRKT